MKKQGKKKAPAITPAKGMAIDAILAQLASMKDNAQSFLEPEPADPDGQEVWKADIEACEAATDILTALQDEGIKDPEQVRNLIHDYNALAEQGRKMHQKYEEPAKPERLGAVGRLCPECRRQIHGTPDHCGNCGKRLGWGR